MGRNNSIAAVTWFVIGLVISVFNDSITKLLNQDIASLTVAFWRFIFSTIVLLPLVFYYKFNSISTKKLHFHALRGLILAASMSLWAYGMRFVPISTVTLMSFTIPIFTVLMAGVFLRERVLPGTMIATLIGFTGSVLTLSPSGISFSSTSVIFIVASILFATLDILNKLLLNDNEKTLPMMFYSNLFSAIFVMFIPNTFTNVLNVNAYNLFLLFLLGVGANLILFCILKAFSKASASFLAPIRYVELLISAVVGFIFFSESISMNTLIGGSCIVLSSVLIDRRIRLKSHVKEKSSS